MIDLLPRKFRQYLGCLPSLEDNKEDVLTNKRVRLRSEAIMKTASSTCAHAIADYDVCAIYVLEVQPC
jgi:hypothetical protein